MWEAQETIKIIIFRGLEIGGSVQHAEAQGKTLGWLDDRKQK